GGGHKGGVRDGDGPMAGQGGRRPFRGAPCGAGTAQPPADADHDDAHDHENGEDHGGDDALFAETALEDGPLRVAGIDVYGDRGAGGITGDEGVGGSQLFAEVDVVVHVPAAVDFVGIRDAGPLDSVAF